MILECLQGVLLSLYYKLTAGKPEFWSDDKVHDIVSSGDDKSDQAELQIANEFDCINQVL